MRRTGRLGGKGRRMITGSNTNVKHRGRLFHVQTEDSGRRNPHVISHVYFGGTILASEKTEYAELLDLESDTLDKDVRSLIEEQHRALVTRLKSGDFDAVIAERLDGKSASTAPTGAVTEPATEPAPEPESEAPAPPPTVPATLPQPSPPRATERVPRVFGDGVVSKKPLDEEILDYLVEKARDRQQNAAGRARKKG